jgi:hypothetical protein
MEIPMRVILAIAVAAAFVTAAWWAHPTFADAKTAGAVSMDPTAMMMTTTQLPSQTYTAF